MTAGMSGILWMILSTVDLRDWVYPRSWELGDLDSDCFYLVVSEWVSHFAMTALHLDLHVLHTRVAHPLVQTFCVKSSPCTGR